MKRIIVLMFLLYLSTALLTAPAARYSRGDIIDEWMLEKYPDWWEWTEESRLIIRDMYESSHDKHAWFPNHFDPPEQMSFRITPDSWKK